MTALATWTALSRVSVGRRSRCGRVASLLTPGIDVQSAAVQPHRLPGQCQAQPAARVVHALGMTERNGGHGFG